MGFLDGLFGKKKGYRSQFKRREWEELRKAPFWVFLLMAVLDGGIKDSEVREIGNQINTWRRMSSGFSKEVLDSIGTDIKSVMKDFVDDTPQEAIDGLSNVKKLLDRINYNEAQRFKKMLIVIGIKISEAHGSMTEEQKKVLALLYKLLDVNIDK